MKFNSLYTSTFILTFLIIFNTFQSLMLILEKNKRFCLDKEIMKQDTLKFSYIVSGDRQDMISIFLIDPNSANLYDNFRQASGNYMDKHEYELLITNPGIYSLCLLSKIENGFVTFEFTTKIESGHLVNLAKDQVFDELYRNITTVSYFFEEINKNLKFYQDRRNSHFKLIEDIINLLQKLTISKIMVIIIFSILQIYIIRRFFPNRKRNEIIKVSNLEETIYL